MREEENIRKVAKSLHIFLATPNEIEKYVEIMQSNSSENCLHCYKLRFWLFLIQNYDWLPINQWLKAKELLSEFKQFKVQTILVLGYQKKNDHKIFHSSAKLINSDSDTDETFKSMHQSIMTKKKCL